MAGLSLAPPPPKWAATVPESVWMNQLLRRTPDEGSGSRPSGRKGARGNGTTGGDASAPARGGRAGGNAPYVPEIS